MQEEKTDPPDFMSRSARSELLLFTYSGIFAAGEDGILIQIFDFHNGNFIFLHKCGPPFLQVLYNTVLLINVVVIAAGEDGILVQFFDLYNRGFISVHKHVLLPRRHCSIMQLYYNKLT